MKKCANCGFECHDEMLSCPSCSSDAFITSSPEALGHIISPAEQRFWEKMTFRHFAIFLIRLQALWLLFYAIIDASYFVEYLIPQRAYAVLTPHTEWILARAAMHVAFAILCLRYADRIVSWFIKDIIPKMPPNTAPEPNADSSPRSAGSAESQSGAGSTFGS